jgi:hypothetical protein
MILIDASQMFIANMMVHLNYNDNVINEKAYKFSIYNSILNYKKKHSSRYGDIVICIDSKLPWRREVFDNYKAVRRKNKASKTSTVNWSDVYDMLGKVTNELIEHFPFKVVVCSRTEADDIIGVLASRIKEKTLIVSSDKDYFQLHKYDHIKQYSPMARKLVAPESSGSNYLREHIIRGDKGDGIPNILSPDSVFVDGGRQTPITKNKVDEWLGKDPSTFLNEEELRNFQRNELLIDFDMIPKDITENILSAYQEAVINPRSKLLNFFIETRQKDLMSEIDNF